MIAIVTAIKEEAAALRWPLRHVTVDYSVTVTGVGKDRALASMQKLFVKYERPDLVLAMGFCGGLADNLRPGCLSLTRQFLAQNEETVFSATDIFAGQARQTLMTGTVPFVEGNSLTVDNIVRSSRRKRSLAKEYGVATVNMEDYWLALACNRAGVPFISIRAVVDAVNDDLPAFVEEFATADDSGRGLGIALGAIKRPGNVLSLLSMAKKASSAKKSLGEFAADFLPHVVTGGIPSPV
jgi:adenosylhomocysteine nucleosidase